MMPETIDSTFRRGLRSRRVESERKTVLQKRLAEVPELEKEFGVGTEECSEPGCERRVLGNMDRCAWHVAGGDS